MALVERVELKRVRTEGQALRIASKGLRGLRAEGRALRVAGEGLRRVRIEGRTLRSERLIKSSFGGPE